MTRPRIRLFTLALTLLGALASAAKAQVIYGVTFSSNQLITINPTTGAGTLVGPLSTPMTAGGLAFRGNKLYAWDNTGNAVKELNPATGATLNSFNIGNIPFLEGDMAFRSDGKGFLVGFAPDPLVQFDITVPNSTSIGPLNPPLTMDGIAMNGSDVLYGISQSGVGGSGSDTSTRLYTINQTTAVATLVGPTGLTGNGGGGLSFDASGKLFAALDIGGATSSLYSINPTTGAATLIGSIGFNTVSGIAIQGGSASKPGNEGSYSGVVGPSGDEGSFGYGGRARRGPVLMLETPGAATWAGSTLKARNVSHRSTVPEAADTATVPDWAVGATAFLALLAAAVGAAALGRAGS